MKISMNEVDNDFFVVSYFSCCKSKQPSLLELDLDDLKLECFVSITEDHNSRARYEPLQL